MDTSNLFTVALNLGNPWSVSKVDFIPATDNPTQMELHIWVSYPDRTKFPCPTEGCGEMCPQHDYEERVWRHLNFFQHKTFIHAKLPRVRWALRVHLWVKFNSIIVQIPCPAILFAHFHLY